MQLLLGNFNPTFAHSIAALNDFYPLIQTSTLAIDRSICSIVPSTFEQRN